MKLDWFKVVMGCVVLCSTTLASTYYVNSVSGLDSNEGTGSDQAWASLQRVNEHVFKAGDEILFAAGNSFFGQLKLKGSGSPAAPIRVDRYGEGLNPAIHGQGGRLYAVLLENVEYWEVRNLEVTNAGGEAKSGRRGVMVRARDFGDCHHIILEGLEIHHVNGRLSKKEGGGSGILWENGGDKVKTRFIGLQILNCHIHHCERNAINSHGNSRRDRWHPSLDVVIRGNLIEHIPGDGIVPIGTEGALVEYNVIRKGVDSLPKGDAAAGIWPWSSDRTLIQFNEVSDHRAKWDGQGYDADFNCIGTVIQYNYSYDNWGGFVLICNNGASYGSPINRGTKDTVIQYNLSINDGLRPYETHKGFFSPTFHITGPVENTKIYRNIIIMPSKPLDEIENALLVAGDWGNAYPEGIEFIENIVRAPQRPTVDWSESKAVQVHGHDDGRNFMYKQRDPLRVLNEFQHLPQFKDDKGFATLKNFIQQRGSER
ncbi:right-handed parallel beta-helix repeat-containing protein [Pontiellaceae bacterium B12227]|nr:right-handed parallel beta-helix repeat-containing protein [Pontiellaceae bacterium B12227]